MLRPVEGLQAKFDERLGDRLHLLSIFAAEKCVMVGKDSRRLLNEKKINGDGTALKRIIIPVGPLHPHIVPLHSQGHLVGHPVRRVVQHRPHRDRLGGAPGVPVTISDLHSAIGVGGGEGVGCCGR